MEFWNELLTKESWEKLQELAKELEFVLIGGWAVYLWTGQHKSKDIDIIVDYLELEKLRSKYALEKNERLKKYEVKFEKFDMDVYAPFYSELAVPVEEIRKSAVTVQGIKTVPPEMLLVLKQGAELERRGSVKGRKDAIDIVTLLLHARIDLKKYAALAKRYKKEKFVGELGRVIREFGDNEIPYVGAPFVEFKKWKKKFLAELRGLR